MLFVFVFALGKRYLLRHLVVELSVQATIIVDDVWLDLLDGGFVDVRRNPVFRGVVSFVPSHHVLLANMQLDLALQDIGRFHEELSMGSRLNFNYHSLFLE